MTARHQTTMTTSIRKFFETLLIVLIVLSMNFKCGHGLDTLAGETENRHPQNTRRLNETMMTRPRLPPLRVRLNKCCHFNEHLDMELNCVAGNPTLWLPKIFFKRNESFYQPIGGSPKFMTFTENVRPIVETNASLESQNQENFTKIGCSSLDQLELFIGDANLVLFPDGSLYLRERGQSVEPRNYCIDHNSALVCFPLAPGVVRQKAQLKVRKCCGKMSSYNSATKNCHITPEISWQQLKLPLNETVFQTVYGFPTCHEASNAYAIVGDWREAILNSTDGTLQLQQKHFASNDYCLEHLREEVIANNTKIKVFTCLHHFAGVGGGAASDASVHTSISPTGVRNVGSSSDRIQVAALNIGLVISVVFLAATLVASYLMPSVHHVLHWRCQIFYVLCLFFGDLLLAFTQLTHSLELGSVECVLVASAMHFFFLAAFFWLNTMCFNIWWTFRDFRPSSLERNQELLRLRLYSAYAWGIPLLITVIAACVDQLPETQLLRPEFGVRSCWFSGAHLSIFAYFFGPVGILLCANIVLFISTTHQLTCGLWKRDDVKSSTEKTALGKVCLKLVVVMGVTWIADIISWLIGGPQTAWFFTDLINALQGVFIFIVVGCQPQVWTACKRFCCPRTRQEITNTTNGVQHSSSSQGLPSLGACGAEITQNTSIHGGGMSTNTIGNSNEMQQPQKQRYQQQAKIPMETVC